LGERHKGKKGERIIPKQGRDTNRVTEGKRPNLDQNSKGVIMHDI